MQTALTLNSTSPAAARASWLRMLGLATLVATVLLFLFFHPRAKPAPVEEPVAA